MHLRNDKMTDLTDATIRLVYDTGAGRTVELDVTELFDISANTFADAALTPIYTLLANSMYKIGRGWTPSRIADFLEVVKRYEIDISIVNHNGVELDIGRELSHLRAHAKTFYQKIVKNNKDITIIVRVLGFGKDDPDESKVDPNAHLSMKQNVMALTGSERIVIMGNSASKLTTDTTLPDGYSPREILSMEAKCSPKEFLKPDTIKCLGKYCLMPWYRDLCVHGSMWGVYIPPSFSLQVNYPMRSLWEKRHVGATIHATRGNMARLLGKLLSNPSMFPRDTFGNTMRDTITNANGDGYAALHNIMRAFHPNLIEKAVDAVTPYQGNSVSIAAHVRNMANFLEKKELRGRLYTQYESLMMVMEYLHGRFKERLKNKSELAFTAKHDHFNMIPFKLEMTNLGTTLTEWSEELKLDTTRFNRPDTVHHINQPGFVDEDDDSLIHAIGSDLNCTLCEVPGHTMKPRSRRII
jgi:hypothetical protein